MTDGQTAKIKYLLKADVVRQSELFGDHRPRKGIGMYLSMLSARFLPVLLYRLSHCFYLKGMHRLAKFFSLINFLLFGIEIATACRIGPGLFFPHTHGTVIGAFSIGSNAVIYQGVTLGARDLDFTYDTEHRPVVGNDVILGAGSKILGGLSLGDRVVVAANAVVLKSFSDDLVVGGVPAKILSSRKA
ncbi:DapH/DapD/GlmU-related protein [Pseudomonas fluorescens]|uniref:serine O-acetyltransferase n=1 Tax=Pseudomonas fluorescens TaxID=294 RepID=UPI003524A8B6